MSEPTLFDFADAPAARSTDPDTSHAAIAAHTKSGKRAGNGKLILAAVVANPGSTSGELAALSGLDRHTVSKRLADLNKKASVYTTGEKHARLCREMKTKQLVWYATGAGPKA